MKKSTLLTILTAILCQFSYAKHIDEATARRVGKSFIENYANSRVLKNPSNMELIFTSGSSQINENQVAFSSTYFYVFNIDQSGFVIVAADDNSLPILGYSDETIFDPQRIPQSVQKWLELYKSQIRYVIENDIPASDEIKGQWSGYINGTVATNNRNLTSVNPLVQTKWNQAPYENGLCPGGSVTGCVATAMAQVMKYWSFPATGTGFHSYNHQKYGTLSANFGSVNYQWTQMPNVLNSSNSAVATLMFHCGVSVDMGYSPESSGAYVITSQSPVEHCAEYAFKTYFGYKNTLKGVERKNYSESQWVNLLKTELDAQRPVIYAGFGSGGGHCFIADGYDNNNFFHFNWGWGGAYDGYFVVNALNPDDVGIGGGNGGFNSGQQIILGLEPPSGTAPTAQLELFDYVRPSSNIINYGSPFTVSTNMTNIGTGNFNGDFCAAVFDEDFIFVDFVQVLTGASLAPGNHYSSNVTFTTNGILNMLPGKYYVAVFYRSSGGNWNLVGNKGLYTNAVQMDVIYATSLELYSDINVIGGKTLTKGQPMSVNVNLHNNGSTTFLGYYQLALFNLDGSFAQTIGTLVENNGLPPDYYYLSPFLNFETPAVTVEPGTYFLALLSQPANSNNWELVGSTNYQNPIRVVIQAAPLQGDQYEYNDTPNRAHNFPVSFTGKFASVKTTGSNLHTEKDIDYYKINLPVGFNYKITARLNDSQSSGDGKTYTVDALWAVSGDGENWLDAFDDLPPGVINVNGGGTVYFVVAPYFAGEKGTYTLEMTIENVGTNATADLGASNLVNVFPNPATDYVYVDMSQYPGKITSLTLRDVMGRKVGSTIILNNESRYELPLNNIPPGSYILEMNASKGLLIKKIIVNK